MTLNVQVPPDWSINSHHSDSYNDQTAERAFVVMHEFKGELSRLALSA